MSQLPGNTFAANAADSMNAARIAGIPGENEAQFLLQEAQIEATLALAYEQRTANLIALQSVGVTDVTDWPATHVAAWSERAIDITTRLGGAK